MEVVEKEQRRMRMWQPPEHRRVADGGHNRFHGAPVHRRALALGANDIGLRDRRRNRNFARRHKRLHRRTGDVVHADVLARELFEVIHSG